MRISQTSLYALYALGHLAGQDGRVVPLTEICANYVLPPKHLAKILGRLAVAGIVRSERGRGGGFALARPAKKISPLEVIEALEGRRRRPTCPLRHAPCRGRDQCPVGGFVHRTSSEMAESLGRTTLADLVHPSPNGHPRRAATRRSP